MRLRTKRHKFSRGDLVQVRSEAEIRHTLDSQNRLEGLPWMPEMLRYCGRVFRVYRRAEKVFLDHYCYVGRLENTVLLEGVRCNGSDHGGCQMGCLLLWKEDWLRPAPEHAHPENPAADELDAAASTVSFTSLASESQPQTSPAPAQRPPSEQHAPPPAASVAPAVASCPSTAVIDTAPQPCAEHATGLSVGGPCAPAESHAKNCPAAGAPEAAGTPEAVFACQATELIHATEPLPWWRPGQYVADWLSGEMSARQFARMLLVQVYNKLQRSWGGRRFGDPRGACRRTPRQSLGLQPGEWVEVKSLPEILATLDRLGRNRGLGFGPEMVPFCGRRLRVAHRVERLVVEWTGALHTLSDTVALEGALCDGLAFRGCPRACYHLWREIWLRRVDGQNERDAQHSARPGS